MLYKKVNFSVLSVLLLISAPFVYDFGYSHSGGGRTRMEVIATGKQASITIMVGRNGELQLMLHRYHLKI